MGLHAHARLFDVAPGSPLLACDSAPSLNEVHADIIFEAHGPLNLPVDVLLRSLASSSEQAAAAQINEPSANAQSNLSSPPSATLVGLQDLLAAPTSVIATEPPAAAPPAPGTTSPPGKSSARSRHQASRAAKQQPPAQPQPSSSCGQGHSGQEKQRRDRINSLIDELSRLVPAQADKYTAEEAAVRRPKHVVLSDTIQMLHSLLWAGEQQLQVLEARRAAGQQASPEALAAAVADAATMVEQDMACGDVLPVAPGAGVVVPEAVAPAVCSAAEASVQQQPAAACPSPDPPAMAQQQGALAAGPQEQVPTCRRRDKQQHLGQQPPLSMQQLASQLASPGSSKHLLAAAPATVDYYALPAAAALLPGAPSVQQVASVALLALPSCQAKGVASVPGQQQQGSVIHIKVSSRLRPWLSWQPPWPSRPAVCSACSERMMAPGPQTPVAAAMHPMHLQ